jgi:demethylmacrocin O-methyltransferase
MNELCTLGAKHRTDKHNAKNFPEEGDLTSVYHGLLKDRKDDVRKVLEIGIGHTVAGREGWMGTIDDYHAGASLFMWEEYFPNAEIFALDIVVEALINQGRIRSFWCDQSSESSLREIIPTLGSDFDLIIDDGSHMVDHQILTANTFMPLLGSNGIYVIEDIHLKDREMIKDGIKYPSEFREVIDTEGLIGDLMLIFKKESV